MTQLAVRPFHETVVEAIRTCGPASTGRIFLLTRLIRDTVIPTGHDQIMAAIDEFFDFPGSTKYAREIREVKESLLAQKQAAAAKKKENETKDQEIKALKDKVTYLEGELQKFLDEVTDKRW